MSKFTGRQITTMVVAACFAAAVAPAGAVAATSSFSITDPVNTSHKARVDKSGRLAVGDGKGALTVDGSVRVGDGKGALSVDGTVRAVTIPSSTWFYPGSPAGGDGVATDLTPFATTTINLSDLNVSNEVGTQPIRLTVLARSAPRSSSVTSCTDAPDSTQVWQTSVPAHSTLNMPFAVPLRTSPSSTNKVCFYANTYSVQTSGPPYSYSTGTISANGSYGS